MGNYVLSHLKELESEAIFVIREIAAQFENPVLLFSGGSSDLKEFISKRGNEKLKELGYEQTFEFNEKKASNLDWFYHLTGGTTHTDFFAVRPTDYSKANEGEDFNDIW